VIVIHDWHFLDVAPKLVTLDLLILFSNEHLLFFIAASVASATAATIER
jgi:hypothetical protein